ncbi:MAG TPA: nitrate/nitrite transporter [Acidimicrobiales bacterium]|nr:nitrate/nitrite transporter [Acidimicrobiales bacterium]
MTDTTLAPAPATGAPPTTPARRHWIDDWRPNDPAFWEGGGKRIALRNLVFSILSEHVGFAVWSLWSVFVLFLGDDYGFTPAQKFLLTTAPTALGALLRLPYTFAVDRFGGRNWTIVSSLLLLVPCVLAGLVLHPGVDFGTLLAVACVAGVGGGNFSSSMANIESFYPERLKGWALGLNAGGGNLGVAGVQLVGLAVLATAGKDHPQVMLAVYIPLVIVAATCAALFMDNLTQATNERRAMRDVCRDPHTAVMSFLYIGTFGSFIGFSFAFGQVLLVQFADTFDTPVKAASLTFLGPLVGSLIRPVGGRLADRFGGARVTIVVFAAMAAGAAVVLAASQRASLALFIPGFIALFALSGLGNGSTYKMIPAIFTAKAARAVAAGADLEAEARNARRLSRALIGIAGSVGAFGGVAVNLALRQSFLSNGTADAAYVAFIAFYLVCGAVTWAVYLRPSPRRLAGV